MKPDFDVIIVGSGPAGVSAAFPLVKAGLRVLMVDGGKQAKDLPPSEDFLSWRTTDGLQAKRMVGEKFHALKMLEAVAKASCTFACLRVRAVHGSESYHW
jgi:thioredoxin reductase